MIGRVLVLATNPAIAERWLAGLQAEPHLQVVLPGDAASALAEIDVVLTDVVPFDRRKFCSAATSAIVVGYPPAKGEVSISADCSLGDLITICRLAAELAQWRRNHAAGIHLSRFDLSLVDELTGLPNRRAWQLELAHCIDQAEQTGKSLCLAIVDLDHFKQVNAGWGHAVGDNLLIASAHALREKLRPGDFVARLGGDEFGLLFLGLPPEKAAAVVVRVRSGVPVLAAREAPHVVGCSAGYACSHRGRPLSAEALFDAADRALATAKQQGRDVTVGTRDET